MWLKVSNVINVSSVVHPPKRNPLQVQKLNKNYGIFCTHIVANILEEFSVVFVLEFELQG